MSTKSIPLREMFGTFAKIGFLSFGGPAAQISLMHPIIVEEKSWLSEKHFLNALSFCMLLPGPEAMQLATYAGWRLHGVIGGLIASLWFVLPGAFIILALATIYSFFGNVPLIGALFLGIKAAVLIIVIEALLRVSKRALKGKIYRVIAALAFIGIFFLALPYPLIVFLAALFGFFWNSKTSELEDDTKPVSAITAAVVGVILNLSVWFGLHVFFKTVTPQKYGIVTLWQPDLASLDWRVVALSALCGILLLKFHWNLIRVLLISATFSWILAEFV